MDPLAVVNLGLGWLGVDPLSSFDDSGPVGRRVQACWEGLRDAVLEDRDWSFASEPMELLRDPTDPPFGFPARYAIPSTVLRIVRAWPGSGNASLSAIAVAEPGEETVYYQIRAGRDSGGQLQRYVVADQDADTLRVEAIVRVEDSSLWSPSFCQALAARIAADLCVPITQNRALAADLWQLYQQKLIEAGAMDGRQGSHVRTRANFFRNRRV